MNVVVILLGLLTAATPPPGQSVERAILGGWCAGSKNAFHEQFSLDVEDGARVFHSWLHDKPALMGTWEVIDRSLVIRDGDRTRMEYKILRASSKRLVVRDRTRKDSEVYVRPGKCIAFENPYTDPNFRDPPHR